MGDHFYVGLLSNPHVCCVYSISSTLLVLPKIVQSSLLLWKNWTVCILSLVSFLVWKYVQKLMIQWAARYNGITVHVGPIFDYNYDGHADDSDTRRRLAWSMIIFKSISSLYWLFDTAWYKSRITYIAQSQSVIRIDFHVTGLTCSRLRKVTTYTSILQPWRFPVQWWNDGGSYALLRYHDEMQISVARPIDPWLLRWTRHRRSEFHNSQLQARTLS